MRPIGITTLKSDKNNFYDTKYEEYTLQNCNEKALQQIKEEFPRETRKEHNRNSDSQLQQLDSDRICSFKEHIESLHSGKSFLREEIKKIKRKLGSYSMQG